MKKMDCNACGLCHLLEQTLTYKWQDQHNSIMLAIWLRYAWQKGICAYAHFSLLHVNCHAWHAGRAPIEPVMGFAIVMHSCHIWPCTCMSFPFTVPLPQHARPVTLQLESSMSCFYSGLATRLKALTLFPHV